MKKAVQAFYAIFLLTLLSQFCNGEKVSISHGNVTGFTVSQSAFVNSDNGPVSKVVNAGKPVSTKTAIRIKALHENFSTVFTPFIEIGIIHFSNYQPHFSNYLCHNSFAHCITKLLRGPPQFITLA